jgi:WD40 repeat protein
LKFIVSVVLWSTLWPAVAGAQEACAPPKITANAKPYNIFSPEQEMILGDLTYQRLSGDLRFVRDPQLSAYLTAIGEKLIKHLPQTGLKFQFHIVDIPEANAFNTPGGHVFVSRKLIAFVRNEDELAGVIAHELGHAVVRHAANDFSRYLKEVLNVTQVGDRKDISDKYNLLLERQRTKAVSRGAGHENEQQLEADQIGLFALVAAGYDPTMFAGFFDRLAETKGRTGSWFGDIFGKTKPEEKRLRTMIKVTEQLPAQCRENRRASTSEEFLKWQADIISARDANRREELPGLRWKKTLAPKLRTDISHLSFSTDGSHFLTQDDFAITVVQREPLQVAFQIPATNAREATFTPDGKFVVFGTENLRYEKWSVADKKPVEIRELVVRRDCWEHEFSPEGKYLACIDYATNLSVLDTQTGNKVWEKKEFYRLSSLELLFWIIALATDEQAKERSFFHIEFSPDARFLVVTRSSAFRYSFKIDGFEEGATEDTLLALELSTLKPVGVGGELKKATRRPFLFLDANRILAMSSKKADESGIFSFPEGKRLAKFPLGGDELKRTANPNYVVVKLRAGTTRTGIFDLTRNIIVGALNKRDVTFWGDQMVLESVTGKVVLSEVRYDEANKILQSSNVRTIEIPVSTIGALEVAELSDNFQWLTISSKSRGAVWELNSGEQKMFVRGFRGALLANNGTGIGDFPRLEPANHSLVYLNPQNNTAEPIREIPERGATQYGQFLLLRRSLKQAADGDDGSASLASEVRFEVRNIVQDKLIWSREFPKEAPGYFFDKFSGRIIFYWTLGSETGKARLKEDATLAARAKQLGNKTDDYLLEVVDAFAGKTVGTMLLETGKGSFAIKSGFSERDWLVLHDSENRVLAYSFNDGELRHRFFGANAAINPVKNQIVVENYPGELTFYDLDTGETQARLLFGSGAAFVRFSLDGKGLFVLSGEQTAYAFDVENLKPQPTSATR